MGTKLVKELPELRSRNSRHYLDDSGAPVARVWTQAVNYKDADGEWQPIDNDLVKDGAIYKNKANDLQATYAGALPDLDVKYVAQSDGLQEYLVARSEAAAARALKFDVDASAGLHPVVRQSSAVEFVDADGTTQLRVPAPVMKDAAGSESGDLAVEVSPRVGGWRLTVTPSAKWTAASDRKLPVTIDPIVQRPTTYDCTIVQAAASQSFCGNDGLAVGRSGGSEKRALLRFPAISTVIPTGTELRHVGIVLKLRALANSNAQGLDCAALTHDWNGSASWNSFDGQSGWTSPGADFSTSAGCEDSRLVDTTMLNGDPTRTYLLLKPLAKEWLEGRRSDFGVVVKASPGADNEMTFNSAESNVDTSVKPALDIWYEFPAGELPSYKMERFSLNDRMSMAVNAETGNLELHERDLTVPGGLGPDLSVARTYNSLPGSANTLGRGWAFDHDISLQDFPEIHTDLHGPGGWWARYDGVHTSTYTTPAGRNDKLEHSGSGWTLTDNASQTKQTFDASGRLVSAADRNGRSPSYTYDASSGKLAKISDSQNRDVTFSYDSAGLPVKMVDPAGRQYQYGYTNGVLTSYTDPAGGVTRFEYGSYGMSRVLTPEGRAIRIEYYPYNDPLGYRVKSVFQVTGTEKYCPSIACIPTQEPTRETGYTTSFSYDLHHDATSTGKVTDAIGTTTSDANDRVTTYSFDLDERVTKAVDALGRTRRQTYDSRSNVQEYFAPFNSGTTGSLSFNYDSTSGNLMGTTQQTGTGSALTTGYGYNESGRVPAGTSGAAFLRTSARDEQGDRLYQWYDAQGNLTRDAAMSRDGTQTRSDVRLDYDSTSPGKLAGSVDGNGNRTAYGYDAKGNLTSVTPPAPLGATTYAYDGASGQDLAMSRISSAQLPDGRSVAYSYDASDRVTKVTYGDGSTVAITYDKDGNVVQRDDSTHGKTTYGYDRLGRITSEGYPDGHTNAYAYDAVGNLKTLTDAGGATQYDYDAINRQSKLTEPGVSTPTTFAYSNPSSEGIDTRVARTLPNSAVVVDDFDQAADGSYVRVSVERVVLSSHWFPAAFELLLRLRRCAWMLVDTGNRAAVGGHRPDRCSYRLLLRRDGSPRYRAGRWRSLLVLCVRRCWQHPHAERQRPGSTLVRVQRGQRAVLVGFRIRDRSFVYDGSGGGDALHL